MVAKKDVTTSLEKSVEDKKAAEGINICVNQRESFSLKFSTLQNDLIDVHFLKNVIFIDADKGSVGGVGTSDEQNGTQAAGEGLSVAGEGDQGEEDQRKEFHFLYLF